jgi:Tfp pilus assembly protein PilF
MTARGLSRLENGRIQEAIDQFTKAIALDPNYREAWEQRAEAYSKQGRGEEAAEDRRRIQGLNASSSPG